MAMGKDDLMRQFEVAAQDGHDVATLHISKVLYDLMLEEDASLVQDEVNSLLEVSYPNFVWGLSLDDMQPLVSRFEILGVLCCTINEVPRRLRNQKEAGLRDP